MLVFALPLLFIALLFLERLLFSRLWGRGIDVSVRFSSAAIREGEGVDVEERSENRNHFPFVSMTLFWSLDRLYSPYRRGASSFSVSSTFHFPRRSVIRCTTSIEGLERGVYTISGGEISSTDLFSIDEYSLGIYSDSILHVYPSRKKMFGRSFAYRGYLGNVLSKERGLEDPFEVKSIRPYLPTDPMRNVNWKATARTGSMKVNQYEWTTEESVMVVLDLYGGSDVEKEELIRYVSSFSALILARGTSISLVTNGRDARDGRRVGVGKGSGEGHAGTIDTALSEIKVSSTTDDLSVLISSLSKDSPASPVLFSVSPEESEIDSFLHLSGGSGAVFLMHGEERKNVFILGGRDE
ncbi:MAG: DUF58 domain-containing protein [Candidatus Ornithospirochaeta sp.]